MSGKLRELKYKPTSRAFKPVPGFTGIYASKSGQIFSGFSGKILKTGKTQLGHELVGVYNRQTGRNGEYVHRLVAKTFIRNPSRKSDVIHKNGTYENNLTRNLEWRTESEQQYYVQNAAQRRRAKKYIVQPDKYSCGPVAIFNALRWAGNKIHVSELKRIKEDAKCVSSGKTKDKAGTMHNDFDRVIRKEGEGIFTVKRIYRPKISEMEEHIRNGGAIAMTYKHSRGRHFMLLTNVSKSGQTFEIINDQIKPPAARQMKRKTLFNTIFEYKNDHKRKAWFLTKA